MVNKKPSDTSTRMGSEFIFENLGYPGTQHELSFCLQTPDCTKTDAERLQDNTERPFEVTALLSKSPFSAGSLKTKYDATDGNSYFTFLSPRMTVDTPWGAVSVYKNESDEASMISMKVQAHTARNALDSMQLAASAVLDYWSFESAVPAYIMHFRAHDITNEAEVFRVSAPFRVKPIGADDTEMPTPLRPVLALYREGLGSGSPVYKFFCFYKILEGYFKRLKPELATLFRESDIAYPGLKEVVPTFDDLDPIFSRYIGKNIKQFFDKVLTKQFRDAVAHFEKDGCSPLLMNTPDNTIGFHQVSTAAEICARTVIQSYHEVFFIGRDAGLDINSLIPLQKQ